MEIPTVVPQNLTRTAPIDPEILQKSLLHHTQTQAQRYLLLGDGPALDSPVLQGPLPHCPSFGHDMVAMVTVQFFRTPLLNLGCGWLWLKSTN